MNKLIKFFKDEEGATAVEYGLMVALDSCSDHCCSTHFVGTKCVV